MSFSHRNGVALNTKHDARNTGQTSTRHTRRKQKKDTCRKDAARLKGQQQRGGNGIGRRLEMPHPETAPSVVGGIADREDSR